jgi:hypothetical protein
MKNNLINEEIKKMRMIMGYNRSKTLNENIEMISEITGAGATAPGETAGAADGNSGQVTKKVYTIPSDLKDVKGFQDWVVSKGFGSELGPRGADGKYGRYTAAAFAKHKGDYLKKPLADDEYDVPVDVDPNDKLTDTNTDPNNVNQTNVNQTNVNTDSDTEDLLKK